MYYWNKDNVETLKQVGEYCAAEAHLKHYGEYCLLREKGLRKPAHQAINAFIEYLKNIPIEKQREISLKLAFLDIKKGNACHQLLPHPLLIFILEKLKDWSEEAPENIDVLYALGHLKRDNDFFAKILALHPTHQMSLARLITAKLDSLYYQTHHLDEGGFIGSVEHALATLQKVENYVGAIENEDYRKAYSEEHRYYKKMLEAWICYCAEERDVSFIEWSEQNHEHFSFPTKYYYQDHS